MSIETKLRDGGLSNAEITNLARRTFLRNGLSLSALTLLTGCDITNSSPVDGFLRVISRMNDGVQGTIFRGNKLAKTFPESMAAKEFRFNAQYGEGGVPTINPETWRLELAGAVQNKQPWTLEQLKAMPQTSYVARHVCVEGWSMIGKWGGVPLRAFLEKVGADTSAKYVMFRCEDPIDYSSSMDMASALHPQTILCLTYLDQPLPPKLGAPMRLKTPIKLGFKQPKHIVSIEVTNQFPGGYWENLGYNWFAGV
jgi:DMSO/TMAO reductase YedYZ molybdopterin-dependent catalytic subunit